MTLEEIIEMMFKEFIKVYYGNISKEYYINSWIRSIEVNGISELLIQLKHYKLHSQEISEFLFPYLFGAK